MHTKTHRSQHHVKFHIFNQISQFPPNFTISTKFHNFNQKSTKFHNFDQISQFRPNFTMSTKFHWSLCASFNAVRKFHHRVAHLLRFQACYGLKTVVVIKGYYFELSFLHPSMKDLPYRCWCDADDCNTALTSGVLPIGCEGPQTDSIQEQHQLGSKIVCRSKDGAYHLYTSS